jgi:predicted transcriptional regulator
MANIKTAISMQLSLYEKVGELARKLKVPRSRVFVLALEEFVQRQDNQVLLSQINEAYQDEPTAEEKKSLRRARRSHRQLLTEPREVE